MHESNSAVAVMAADLPADRNAIRMEYEATGADPRVLHLLHELELAERTIAQLGQQLTDLQRRLTRRTYVR